MTENAAETRAMRPGEEIDIANLSLYLAKELGVSGDEIDVTQFPAGSSNLTYLVSLGRKEYVLRRPPIGNTVKSAHDMNREFEVLSKLSEVYAPAPRPLLYSRDASIIGSEFYLMERREGLIVRGKFPGTHSDIDTSQEVRLQVCRSFIENLADLHTLDPAAAGLETLGRIDGYNRRQVEGWSKRYVTAKTDEWPDIENAITWLNDNIQPEFASAIIHNDYKFDNVMLDREDLTRITAVLDWEMATIGDPLMDIGTTLGYWMSRDAPVGLIDMPFNPKVLMENVTRSDLVEMYENSLGRALPDMLFYYVFGTFKIAVIAQQIYARFVKGSTKDKRFAHFDKFVAALGRIANNAIGKGRI